MAARVIIVCTCRPRPAGRSCRELDEKLRQSDSEKRQYKEQLLRALQEIARMKQVKDVEADKVRGPRQRAAETSSLPD
jgi:hypothetical protein